MKKTNWKKN